MADVTVKVLRNLKHGETVHEPGATIKLPADEAEALAALGAVEVVKTKGGKAA